MTQATIAKSRRIEARIDAVSEQAIARAAELVGQSRSSFVVAAALREADRVLGRSDITLMSDEQFDAMMDAFDHPRSLPVLERVARQPRIYRSVE